MESSASAQGPQVVILLGSKSDMEHRAAIARGLDRFASRTRRGSPPRTR